MKNGVKHITYNCIKEVAEVYYTDGTNKEFPMTAKEWEESIKDGKIYVLVTK